MDDNFGTVLLWNAIRFLLLFSLGCGVLFVGEPDMHDALVSLVQSAASALSAPQ